jgi:hypothetical protein
MQLKAAVGSCFLAKAGAKKRVLTLGLLVQQVENQTFKKDWAINVSHGFVKEGDQNAEKVALICPSTGTSIDCASCTSNQCFEQCTFNKLQTLQVATGNEVKVSSFLYGTPDDVVKSDFAAFIMKKPLKALNIRGIKQIIEHAPTDIIDPALLSKAQAQFAGFNGASGGICSVAKLKGLLETNKTPFVFKKGAVSNWTWGVLGIVDDDNKELVIEDPWKPEIVDPPLFCKEGDCGSIVFVLDENNKASPIGYIHSSSKLEGENTTSHIATSFERILKGELVEITGIAKANWKINLDTSFKYI